MRASRLSQAVMSVVDLWSRQSPILEGGTSLSGVTVGEALDRVLGHPHTPPSVTLDHGRIHVAGVGRVAYQRGVQLDFIRPGKPEEKRLHRIVQRAARPAPSRTPSGFWSARRRFGDLHAGPLEEPRKRLAAATIRSVSLSSDSAEAITLNPPLDGTAAQAGDLSFEFLPAA